MIYLLLWIPRWAKSEQSLHWPEGTCCIWPSCRSTTPPTCTHRRCCRSGQPPVWWNPDWRPVPGWHRSSYHSRDSLAWCWTYRVFRQHHRTVEYDDLRWLSPTSADWGTRRVLLFVGFAPGKESSFNCYIESHQAILCDFQRFLAYNDEIGEIKLENPNTFSNDIIEYF